MAESSRVRSNHWLAWVCAALSVREMTYLANEQMRSQRIGFLLYAIALDPTCFVSNGSSNSFRFINNLISTAILLTDWAMPKSVDRIKNGVLRIWAERGGGKRRRKGRKREEEERREKKGKEKEKEKKQGREKKKKKGNRKRARSKGKKGEEEERRRKKRG